MNYVLLTANITIPVEWMLDTPYSTLMEVCQNAVAAYNIIDDNQEFFVQIITAVAGIPAKLECQNIHYHFVKIYIHIKNMY